MNIPAHLLDDPKPVLNYRKSVYTWIAVGSAGVTIIPYVFFVISYSKRVLNRNLFLEHLGENTATTLNGTQDMLTYVFMLFMGIPRNKCHFQSKTLFLNVSDRTI